MGLTITFAITVILSLHGFIIIIYSINKLSSLSPVLPSFLIFTPSFSAITTTNITITNTVIIIYVIYTAASANTIICTTTIMLYLHYPIPLILSPPVPPSSTPYTVTTTTIIIIIVPDPHYKYRDHTITTQPLHTTITQSSSSLNRLGRIFILIILYTCIGVPSYIKHQISVQCNLSIVLHDSCDGGRGGETVSINQWVKHSK